MQNDLPRAGAPSDSDFGFLVSDVARLLHRAFDHRGECGDLTRAQWQVLVRLAKNEGGNQASLAGDLDIEPITLSRHIDRLESAGLVDRRADPEDRRARRLYLTEAARPLLDAMRAYALVVFEHALTGLEPAERAELLRLLTHGRGNLGVYSAGTAPLCQTEPDASAAAGQSERALT